MSFKTDAAAVVLLVASQLISVSPSLSASQPEITQLDSADQEEFNSIVEAIDRWSGDEAEFKNIIASIGRASKKHPNFVPLQVERGRLEWARISRGMGLVLSSQSFLPVFLELRNLAPAYPKTHLLAARAYIFTNDFNGALPSLEQASKLAPDDPDVDIAWAMFHERQIHREEAVSAARAAIHKANGDAKAMALALTHIATNNGITDAQAAYDLAMAVRQVQSDPIFLTSVLSTILDVYSFQPGLLDVAVELAQLAPGNSEPSASLLLQWARIGLVSGNFRVVEGMRWFDPAYLKQSEEILSSIQNRPEVAFPVWSLCVDIALSKGQFDDAERLIAEGNAKGFSAIDPGLKNAALLNAQDKPREAAELYHELNLPDDDLVMLARARTGGRDESRMYFARQIDEDPVNPRRLSHFASFLLHYFKDASNAIDYGTRAYKLMPDPVTKQTLASAYLQLSGEQLRTGGIDAALNLFERAQSVGYDEKYVLQTCYKNCEEIQAALTAFR